MRWVLMNISLYDSDKKTKSPPTKRMVFSPILEKGRAVWEKFSSTIETVKNLAAEKLSGILDKTVTAYEQVQSIIVGKVISSVLQFSWNTLIESWNVASGLVSADFEKLECLLHIDFSFFLDTLSSEFVEFYNSSTQINNSTQT